MKIEMSVKDYTHNGLGYNNFNFINNMLNKLSQWTIATYSNNNNYMTDEEQEIIAGKIERIVNIINE